MDHGKLMRLHTNIITRSSQEVTERLDRVIGMIRNTQRPYMHGEKPVDIVLVRLRFHFAAASQLTISRLHMVLFSAPL